MFSDAWPLNLSRTPDLLPPSANLPSMTTMLAKSRCQTEWSSVPLREQTATTSFHHPHTWLNDEGFLRIYFIFLSPCVKGKCSFYALLINNKDWFDLRKKCMIVFPCYKHSSGPAYLSELPHVCTPSRTLRSSSDTRMLKIKHEHKIYGFCFFSCFGPPHLEFTPTRQTLLNPVIF